ncbi:DNA repair protein [Verrucomicrobia bacterium IMCC26134]|nr:DNA repair protein [Verrucomicrobia bacterium IMCC26134]
MKTSFFRATVTAVVVTASMLVGGCQSNAYYSMMEKMGKPKREILVNRVTETRAAQEEAKNQFRSALDQFLAVTKVDGGDLLVKYEGLASELKESEAKAKAVKDRIAALDSVATALFSEWKRELGQYTSEALRAQSEAQYKDTLARYQKLTASMQKAAGRMEPVLASFRDQVLFLKHNLNARAVTGLSGTARDLERDISRLVSEMERSITEADAFIRTLQGHN